MRLLQFCRETFVRMPPNITGWSAALEALLLQRGIRLDTKVSYVPYDSIARVSRLIAVRPPQTLQQIAAVVYSFAQPSRAPFVPQDRHRTRHRALRRQSGAAVPIHELTACGTCWRLWQPSPSVILTFS